MGKWRASRNTKKGGRRECENWRGVTLLCSISKILASILHHRIYPEADKTLRQEQAGFIRGKSGFDQIATIRIIEEIIEKNSTLILVFVDFAKAFDSMNHEALWRILRQIGIPPKMIKLIKMIYNGANYQVLHNGYLTKKRELEKGVKQGCIMSSLLFNICLDYVMRNTIDNDNGII